MPCVNNLVVFDQLKRTESLETLVGELAEKWSWQDNYRNLVFFLRKDVKWHDGKLWQRLLGGQRLRRQITSWGRGLRGGNRCRRGLVLATLRFGFRDRAEGYVNVNRVGPSSTPDVLTRAGGPARPIEVRSERGR